MEGRRDASAPSSPRSPERPAAKRRKNGVRGRRWIITLNDRLDRDPSHRWVEEAKARGERDEEILRGRRACSEEEEEADEDAVANVDHPGCDAGEVGGRVGHFCHPSEIEAGLRCHAHISYYVGQLERGPENGKSANVFFSLVVFAVLI